MKAPQTPTLARACPATSSLWQVTDKAGSYTLNLGAGGYRGVQVVPLRKSYNYPPEAEGTVEVGLVAAHHSSAVPDRSDSHHN